MDLKDIVTLRDVAKKTGIGIRALQYRLGLPGFNMVEGEDFRRLGQGQSTILTPKGAKKIILKETLQAIVKGELENPIETLADLLQEGIITKDKLIELPIPPKMRGLVLEKIKEST
jgi:hypothetical protein